MTVLEERGLFWWNHEPIPDGQFAPSSCVPGLLKIDDDGRTTLELDGCLPSDKGPMSVLLRAEDAELDGKGIEGLLTKSHKHVLLCNLSIDGGRFSTGGLSYEQYLAITCLVGDSPPKTATNTLLFQELEIDLNGFNGWLRLRAIEISRTESSISVEYTRKNDAIYALEDGNISITYDISGPWFGKSKSDTLSLYETISLIYSPKEQITLEDMKIQFGLLEGLFIVLTDSEYCLRWPSLVLMVGETRIKYKWYFLRIINATKAPKWYESNKLRPGAGHVWTYGFRVEEKTRTIRAWVLPLPRGTTRYSTISRTSPCDLDMGD